MNVHVREVRTEGSLTVHYGTIVGGRYATVCGALITRAAQQARAPLSRTCANCEHGLGK